MSTPTDSKPSNPPSGIARLRQSADQAAGNAGNIDSMNLDDFIVPSSIASPSGISPSPSISDTQPPSSSTTTHTTAASAIPIRKQLQLQDDDFVSRASAPTVAPTAKIGGDDFAYVQRHVRKTSIDERRVSVIILTCFVSQSLCFPY